MTRSWESTWRLGGRAVFLRKWERERKSDTTADLSETEDRWEYPLRDPGRELYDLVFGDGAEE